VRHNQQKSLEIEMFDHMAQNGGYFSVSRDKYLTVMNLLGLENTVERKPLVLDIGCGIGEQAEIIKSIGNNVVGVDISYNAIRVAKAKSVEKALGIDYIVADIENLPFKEEVFDICFCGLVFHHFPELSEVARQIHNVLGKKGKVFSYDPNGFNPYEFLGTHVIKRLGGVAWKSENERFIFPRELRRTFSEAGCHTFTFQSILLFSEKKMSLFYRLRRLVYKSLYILMPKISRGNMLVMKCEK
jgi:SAM-dependent methyltransferase